jgi:3-hydroxybutyryl-CoA dehydrogenase
MLRNPARFSSSSALAKRKARRHSCTSRVREGCDLYSFITPAQVVRAVKLIYVDYTPSALVEWGRKFLDTIDHVGVACKERIGFLINRLQYALLAEVYRVLDEGVASRDDVDTAIRLSIDPRLALWAPLLTEDLVVSKKTTVA